MFILAVGALSRRSRAGAWQLLSSRAALAGAPSVPWLPPTTEPRQAGLFLLLYQKRDSPTHFLHPLRSAARGCHTARGANTSLWGEPGASLPPVAELWAPHRHGKRKEHTVTVTLQSCDCWHWGHLPGSCQGRAAGLCLSKQGKAPGLAHLSFQPHSGMILRFLCLISFCL